MDFLRLVFQALAAAFIIAFFLLAAVVIFGTALACLRTRRPARKAVPRSARPPARPISSPRAPAVRS